MGNPISACMSFNFLKQSSSANGTNFFISVNMSPPSDFFERVKFYDCRLKFSLTAKRSNVPGMAAISHINILRISEIQMVFWKNRNENIGVQQ